MRITRKGWYVEASSDSGSGNAKDDAVRGGMLQKLGLPFENLITCKQVHGDKVAVVEDNQRRLYEGFDGLVTDQKQLVLGIYSADCAPVLISDDKNKVVGAFHCGWRGAENRIVPKGIGLMRERWKSDPSDLKVSFGAHIRDCCYEVGGDVAKVFPGALRQKEGKTFLSLERAVAVQAEEAGVPKANIQAADDCTYCGSRHFSWRRDKTEHRMISLIAKL